MLKLLMRLLLPATIMGSAFAFAAPASVANGRDWRVCKSADVEKILCGCKAIIESRRKGKWRAEALVNRAKVYGKKK